MLGRKKGSSSFCVYTVPTISRPTSADLLLDSIYLAVFII
ncbi:hypothetical protein GQ55_9G315200 [Panicum hallii var. hallii]|uniref:Uncharacterized protein n=1 Tax=Panicum hallii var. hallii TaxID=1504633 RepID=A0A2T7C815_9POAL|nr:hypothetical protein GQ55_9G315200 [Panicum hallii var. hallii]